MRLDAPLRTRLDAFQFAGDYFEITGLPYGHAVALGMIDQLTPLDIPGWNDSIGTTEETVWEPGGVYTWQTADQQIRVKSSDADDDGSPADTGANTIRIWWLNSANTESTLDVTMNGTTFVDTAVLTCRRINRAEVLTAGSTGTNEGAITIYATDGATIIARIPAGHGRLSQVVQTVPAGYFDVLTGWCPNTRFTSGHPHYLRLIARTSPSAPWILLDTEYGNSDYRTNQFPHPIVLAAGTDYTVTGRTYSLGNVGAAHVYGWRQAVTA